MKVYGYGKCSTVRKALKYLDGKKIKYQFEDMVENGITQKAIKEIDKLVGDIDVLINKSSTVYRQLKLKDKLEKMTKAQKIKLLAENPKLIKRPLVVKGKQVLVGFEQKLYKHVLVDGKKASTFESATKKTGTKKAAPKTTKKAATKTTKKTTAKKPATKKTVKKTVAKK